MTANGNYDDKFNAYVRWVKEMVPVQLERFMSIENGPGNKYFTCTLELNDKNTTTQKCPIGSTFYVDYTDYTIYYNLDDSDGFFKELEATYGIVKTWVQLGDKEYKNHCGPSRNCQRYDYKSKGQYPIPAANYTVDNPKDVIVAAAQGLNDTLTSLAAFSFEFASGMYDGADADVLNVMIMPVSLAMQAVDAMAQVIVIGEEEKEEERKQLILEIVSAILFVLPFAGEALGAEVGTVLGALGRIISIIGATGNAALTFYDISNDPESAPMQILGLLLGGRGGSVRREASDMSDMAKLRRGMKDGDIGKMGSVFKKNDDAVQKLLKMCRSD